MRKRLLSLGADVATEVVLDVAGDGVVAAAV
jgi:hypothetical protein